MGTIAGRSYFLLDKGHYEIRSWQDTLAMGARQTVHKGLKRCEDRS